MSKPLEAVLPEGWDRPPGASHALRGRGREILIIGGQFGGKTGFDAPPEGTSLAEQFCGCLRNVVTVVEAAGGNATDVASLRIFVTDVSAYKNGLPEIAAFWRGLFGRHFPAMTLVGVNGLYDPTVTVEVEATALIENRG